MSPSGSRILRISRGKVLLPNGFLDQNRIEAIKALPFHYIIEEWLQASVDVLFCDVTMDNRVQTQKKVNFGRIPCS
ncbi:MAG: hypothetical protein OXC92_10610 [Flavobacteriaceae bacterium]|nr:hypothetical protein [Flavobacteriaceae bacterium]